MSDPIPPNPLSALPAAERRLAAALDAAADALDSVGSHRLTDSLARLQLASARAEDRILRAREVALLTVSRLATVLDGHSADFLDSIGAFAPDEPVLLSGPVFLTPSSPIDPARDEIINLAANFPVPAPTVPEDATTAEAGPPPPPAKKSRRRAP